MGFQHSQEIPHPEVWQVQLPLMLPIFIQQWQQFLSIWKISIQQIGFCTNSIKDILKIDEWLFCLFDLVFTLNQDRVILAQCPSPLEYHFHRLSVCLEKFLLLSLQVLEVHYISHHSMQVENWHIILPIIYYFEFNK